MRNLKISIQNASIKIKHQYKASPKIPQFLHLNIVYKGLQAVMSNSASSGSPWCRNSCRTLAKSPPLILFMGSPVHTLNYISVILDFSISSSRSAVRKVSNEPLGRLGSLLRSNFRMEDWWYWGNERQRAKLNFRPCSTWGISCRQSPIIKVELNLIWGWETNKL